MGTVRPAATLLLVLPTSACGLVFQSVAGWSEESAHEAERTHRVAIATVPPGARVRRVDAAGTQVEVGVSPAIDVVPYRTYERVATPPETVTPLVLGAVIDTILSIAAVVGAVRSEDDIAPLFTMGAAVFLVPIPIAELVAASVWTSAEPETLTHQPVDDGSTFTYVAASDGFLDASRAVRVPWDSGVELELARRPAERVVEIAPARAVGEGKVVAILPSSNRNGDLPHLALDPALVQNVGGQLAVYVARAGFRTVDASAQNEVLEQEIRALKRKSYDECYDQACQIELGKALAAAYIVRSNVTRFGSKCVLNAELIDLRTEVVVVAASAAGSCAPEGLLELSEDVAEQLAFVAR